jgi:hypothetical protein
MAVPTIATIWMLFLLWTLLKFVGLQLLTQTFQDHCLQKLTHCISHSKQGIRYTCQLVGGTMYASLARLLSLSIGGMTPKYEGWIGFGWAYSEALGMCHQEMMSPTRPDCLIFSSGYNYLVNISNTFVERLHTNPDFAYIKLRMSVTAWLCDALSQGFLQLLESRCIPATWVKTNRRNERKRRRSQRVMSLRQRRKM